MKVLMFWVCSLGLIALGQILEGGHVSSVIQGTAAFIVFGPCLTYLFYKCGFKGFFKFWQRAITSKLNEADHETIDRTCLISLMTGGIGAILGLIHVMENLADTSKLGAGIAVAFVSVCYGYLPTLLLVPITHSSSDKSSKNIKLVDRKTGGFYSAMGFMILLLSFFVILYATSSRGPDTHSRATSSVGNTYAARTIPMETFVSNVTGTEGKIAKFNAEFEVDSEATEAEFNDRKVEVRDMTLRVAQTKTLKQLVDLQGREAFREQIKEGINSFIVSGKVKRVFFTDFVIN